MPKNYPFSAPRVKFTGPRPFHPQIYATGEVAFEFLQIWQPNFLIKRLLTELQKLLDNPSSKYNSHALIYPEAWQLFTKDPASYWEYVKKNKHI